MISHNINNDLSDSKNESRKSYWTEKIYPVLFPNMVGSELFDNDPEKQKLGIDRIIYLPDGKEIRVDEKIRKKDYGDILLEEYSDKDKKTPGWIEKKLDIHYIVYNIIPSCKCFFIPFADAQKAWELNKKNWKCELHRIKDSYNEVNGKTYITRNCKVSPDELFSEMNKPIVYILWGKTPPKKVEDYSTVKKLEESYKFFG